MATNDPMVDALFNGSVAPDIGSDIQPTDILKQAALKAKRAKDYAAAMGAPAAMPTAQPVAQPETQAPQEQPNWFQKLYEKQQSDQQKLAQYLSQQSQTYQQNQAESERRMAGAGQAVTDNSPLGWLSRIVNPHTNTTMTGQQATSGALNALLGSFQFGYPTKGGGMTKGFSMPDAVRFRPDWLMRGGRMTAMDENQREREQMGQMGAQSAQERMQYGLPAQIARQNIDPYANQMMRLMGVSNPDVYRMMSLSGRNTDQGESPLNAKYALDLIDQAFPNTLSAADKLAALAKATSPGGKQFMRDLQLQYASKPTANVGKATEAIEQPYY